MDRIRRRAIAVASVIILLTAAVIALLPVIRVSGRNADLPSAFDLQLAKMTNDITRAFHLNELSHAYPCVVQTFESISSMTNATLRLGVVRHLASEVSTLNLTNSDYRTRDHDLCCGMDSINDVYKCLLVADAPEIERCKFLFDALENFKNGALVTLDENPIRPSKEDNHGYGPSWAQVNCKAAARDFLKSAPSYLDIGIFRMQYPKFSPEVQKYFRGRFRAVFGIEYIPYSEKEACLWGLDGTRWSGRDLEWR